MTSLFQLSCASLPPSARVVAFEGREAISDLYRFDIGVVMPRGEVIDVEAAMGQRATLALQDAAQGPQRYQGVLRSVQLVHAWAEQSLYRLLLMPELADLTLTRHSTVYVDIEPPEIWRLLLTAGKALPDGYANLALSGNYPKRLHVCQYKENHYQFLCRQLEREGAYFLFAHDDSADFQPEQLVITDHAQQHEPSRAATVRYVPLTGDAAMSGEAMDGWTMCANAQPRDVTTADYDYLNPALDVRGGPVDVSQDGGGGWRVHGDDVRTPDDAKRLASFVAEAMRAERIRFVGNGRVYHLRAGYTFELTEHPHDALNRRYLALEVQHYGNDSADADTLARLGFRAPVGEASYRAAVTAMDAEVQYRHPRCTTVPSIHGIERAFVDGPADSEYAQLDEHGRYKVAIHFDEMKRTPSEGNGSTWLRMLQPHGGETEGFHFPLRKGTEVMVSFVGGDPDRPVIVGVAPNAHKPSPVLEANQTQNVVQTGGRTRIEIEDKDGHQYIDISTPPKDTYLHLGKPHNGHSGYIVEHTEGNHVVSIGGDQDITVGGNRTIDVTGVQKEHVVGDVTENYDATHKSKVTGLRKRTIGGNEVVEVTGMRDDRVNSGVHELFKGHQVTIVDGPQNLSVMGEQRTFVNGQQVIETTGARVDKVGGALVQSVTDDISISCRAMLIKAPAGITQQTDGGWYTYTQGVSNSVHLGMKNSFMAAATISVHGGAAASVFGGLKFSANCSASLDLTYGLALRYTGGAKADFGAAITLFKSPITVETSPIWVRRGAETAIESAVNTVIGEWIVL